MNFNENVEELEKYNKDTPFYTYAGQVHLAKVVKCVDGDTVYCVFKQGDTYHKFNIRMAGYDSPEMRPSKKIPEEKRVEIKEKALLAKNRLKELIGNKCIYLFCEGDDKYGRILGTIKLQIDDERSINQQMIDEGHGYPYNGGTKLTN